REQAFQADEPGTLLHGELLLVGQRVPDPRAPLVEPAVEPEPQPEAAQESHDLVASTACAEPRDLCSKRVDLDVDEQLPRALFARADAAPATHGQCDEVRREPFEGGVELARSLEALVPELAKHRQHREAALPDDRQPVDDALVEQGRKYL